MTDLTGLRARVEGVDFTGEKFRNVRGCYITEATGLLGGVDPTLPSVSLVGGDGLADLPNTRSDPRVITLTGFLYSPDLRELGSMIRRVDGILADPESRGPFMWSEFGEWFYATVRRGRGSRTIRRGSTGRADFTLVLRAASQRYYGLDPVPFGPASSVVAFHRGNYPAQPMIQIPGPHTGFTITGPGGLEYTTTQDAGAGQVHEVNMRTGQLFLDGAAQTQAVTSADVWTIPAGARVPMSITGAPSMTVRVPDTYI